MNGIVERGLRGTNLNADVFLQPAHCTLHIYLPAVVALHIRAVNLPDERKVTFVYLHTFTFKCEWMDFLLVCCVLLV